MDKILDILNSAIAEVPAEIAPEVVEEIKVEKKAKVAKSPKKTTSPKKK